jgi:prolyl-tRNA synthetase
MKDAYSFNVTEEDFMKTYQDFYDAYSRICAKFGLEYYPCIADSGALGGDYCHEFQIPCAAGDDKIVVCPKCNYAANTEKAEIVREISNPDEELKPYAEVPLPYGVAKIKELVAHYHMPADRFIKNVVYKTNKNKLVIATVTGNLDVNTKKLINAVNLGDLELATDEDLASIGAKSGFVHSWGYDEHKDRIIFVADESITLAKNLYGGHKTDTTDPINVNYDRDFKADIVADVAEPIEGANCKKCGADLTLIRTVEFGHIFKYDHFYTQHHDGYYVDKDGQKKLMYMGAYGIGIERAIAIIVETHHDEKGIIWPEIVAPYDIHLVTLGDVETQALEAVAKLEAAGYEVLWDDRTDVTAGTKFNDADLIGIPTRIVLSTKSLEKGGIEVKKRAGGEAEIMTLGEFLFNE